MLVVPWLKQSFLPCRVYQQQVLITRFSSPVASWFPELSLVIVQGGGQELEAVKGHLQEAMRENTILKRAVQIQNTRMQEMATREQQASHQASQDSLQMQQLKQMVVQYQAKIQQLEMNNYKMTMHIRNADAAARQGSNRFPDVF